MSSEPPSNPANKPEPLPLLSQAVCEAFISLVDIFKRDVVSVNSSAVDMTIKRLCMNLHFFRGLVSAMNIILGHYNLIILLELMV